MAQNSKIEWTGDTWNPITGCKIISRGCKRCYAMREAAGRLKNHPSRKGLTVKAGVNARPVWNGEVRFNEAWLYQPLDRQKGRFIFACAHSDLFYSEIPDPWIDRILAVMALSPWHVFQVLTKRARRMYEYFSGDWKSRVLYQMYVIDSDRFPRSRDLDGKTGALLRCHNGGLDNLWLGVSVEDDRQAIERIDLLRRCPGPLHWLSLEPLLGGIDFNPDWFTSTEFVRDSRSAIKWMVVGGESGPASRTTYAGDIYKVVRAGKRYGCPVFVKQLGADFHGDAKLTDRKGANMDEWPTSLKVREWPDAAYNLPRKFKGRPERLT